MTREKLAIFAIDIYRFGPLATVVIATLVCLPSLRQLVADHLTPASMLGRYCAAFALATIGVRIISHVVTRYATQNLDHAIEREDSDIAPSSRTS